MAIIRRKPVARVALVASVAACLAAATARPLAQGAHKPPITWAAGPAARGAAGDILRLEVMARIDDGWHLYSLTQPAPPDPTSIAVAEGQAFSLKGAVEAPAPEKGFDAAQGAETEYYTGQVTFGVPVAAAENTAPGNYAVTIAVRWQACNGSLCLRPQTLTVEVPVQLAARSR